MSPREEIQSCIQKIEENLQKLENKQIYELTRKKGTPKCETLADNIEEELQRLTKSYDVIWEEKEDIAEEEDFESLAGMLQGVSREIKDLAKKQADGLLNAFKVKQVNRILIPLKGIMEGEVSKPFLDLVEEAEEGQKTSRNSYSDVAIILCQYEEACREYRDKYYKEDKLFH